MPVHVGKYFAIILLHFVFPSQSSIYSHLKSQILGNIFISYINSFISIDKSNLQISMLVYTLQKH